MTALGTLMLISVLILVMPNLMRALLQVIGLISLLAFTAIGTIYIINLIF